MLKQKCSPKKNKIVNRKDLTKKIIKLAKLSQDRKTKEYFSKKQLMELVLRLTITE